MSIIKSIIRSIRNYLRWALKRPNAPVGAILMLHRIVVPESDGIWYNQHLKLSPQTFETMADYAKKRKCRFVSLDEMIDAVKRKRRIRRWIAVTLDDGYRDNYQNGAPVFKKMQVPYAIYVCTKMVEGEMLYWWELLEQLVIKHDRITLSDGRSFNCSTKDAKEQAFLDIREIILQLPQKELMERMKELLSNYHIDYTFGNDYLGLTWEQLRELKEEPLATIGNHSYSHLAFTGCSDEEIKRDIQNASDEMLHKAGIAMRHFAFPFGEATAVSQHDVELVKGLGFMSSATTNDGLVCYGTDPLELPRLFVTEKNWKQVIDRIAENC